jgi:hypothetical protein
MLNFLFIVLFQDRLGVLGFFGVCLVGISKEGIVLVGGLVEDGITRRE